MIVFLSKTNITLVRAIDVSNMRNMTLFSTIS